MTSMKQTPLTCSGHTRPVVHLSFSEITEHGYFMISACKDGKPMLRQGETGDWIGTFEGHKGAVWAATLNSDATKAATGAADFTAKVWNALTGEEMHTFSHKHIVKCVDFSPDGSSLLTGGNEKLLRVYDLNKPDSDPLEFGGHTSGIRCCLWATAPVNGCDKDSRLFFSSSDDKTIRLWDTRQKENEVRRLELSSAVVDLELSPDSRILLAVNGKKVSFYDTNKFEKIVEHEVPSVINSASLHRNKQTFVCGGDDFKMYKFDFNTGAELESFKGHFGPVHCVRFSPDGELYASGSEDGTLRLWQTTVGKTYGLWRCVQQDDSPPVNSVGNGEPTAGKVEQ